MAFKIELAAVADVDTTSELANLCCRGGRRGLGSGGGHEGKQECGNDNAGREAEQYRSFPGHGESRTCPFDSRMYSAGTGRYLQQAFSEHDILEVRKALCESKKRVH